MSLRFMTLFLSDGSFCCWQAAATPADYQPQVYEPVCGWASTPRQVAMRCLGPRTLLRWPASERCLARGHLGDLGRFYALEEFYAQDLEGYYSALVTHPHHNYYEGRNEAEITPWLSYFLRGIAFLIVWRKRCARRLPAWMSSRRRCCAGLTAGDESSWGCLRGRSK